MKVLAVESSCDETSVAVVENGREVYSNVIASQIDTHKKFGGVVPEIASRQHVEAINTVLKEGLDEDEFTLVAIDAGAEDVIDRGEAFEIITEPEDYHNVRKVLEDEGHTFIESDITFIPQTETSLTEEDDIKNMEKLIDALEDNDDVTDVFTSWERD